MNISSPFRDLYTRVLLHADLQDHAILGVTSAIDGEGKTTIASEFAATLAADGALSEPGKRAGGHILLVECNQGPPGVSQKFGVPPRPGLIQFLQRECELEVVIKSTPVSQLSVIPSGGIAPNFPVLIRTPRMQETAQGLRERFNLIIFDLPSVLTSTDLGVLVKLIDQLLLVVRQGVTPSKLVSQAIDEIGPEKLAGVVLNDSRPELPDWLEHRL